MTKDEKSTERAALAQEAQEVRHVGDSQFEGWYASYIGDNLHTPKKQLCRDAYTAGMSDPGAAPQSVPAQPVAIYQVRVGNSWVDSNPAEYAAVSNEKRIVYSAPPAATYKFNPAHSAIHYESRSIRSSDIVKCPT